MSEELKEWDEVDAALSPKQKKVVNSLMGQVMKATKGKADPELARRMIIKRLCEETFEPPEEQ